MRTVAAWGLAVTCMACQPDGTDLDPDTDTPGCTVGEAFEWGEDVGAGTMQDGDDVAFGTPPQGGVGYTPFEIRMKGAYAVGERRLVHGDVFDDADDTLLGTIEQQQAFFCSNTGVHAGWWYGNEVHIRFTETTESLEALDGRPVRVRMQLDMADDDVRVSEATGTLRWTLGR